MKIIQINVWGFDNNFSYLVIGEEKKALLIDPTGSLEEIKKALNTNNAVVEAIALTHAHPDHCELAKYFESKGAKKISFEDFTKKAFFKKTFKVAGIKIEAISTPGHTNDSVCFIIENNIFTGDTLFARGVGTTAYGGDGAVLKQTLDYLSTLDENLILWPGHNYGGTSVSLREALINSNIKPGKIAHEEIKKKVKEYEKKI